MVDDKPVLWRSDGTVSSWDGLRRDQDLWAPSGDCAIYLYAQGQSRRGPSFQVPYQALIDAQCGALLDRQLSDSDPSDSSSLHSRNSSNGTTSSPIHGSEGSEVHRIYLGAPQHLSKAEALNWHVTTRNFFAWILHKPLVGSYLSQALTELLSRMSTYRDSSADNVADLIDYADSFGYSDFANKPDLALAMLSFADECKSAEVWTDAFVHCVAMNESLAESREYRVLRSVNKALVRRSALQMELQLEKYSNSIDNLLLEDLSETRLSLSPGSRRHLDQFRSFLQSHFKTIYGSWPLPKEHYPKALYQELLVEFDCLYSYLADLTSPRNNTRSGTSSNLNTQRIIDSFDEQRSLDALPFTNPLLPDIVDGAGHRTQAHWALQAGKLGSKNKPSPVDIVRKAYASATNRQDQSVLASPLVQSFERFESDMSKSFDDQLSFADARKVRWILIYTMLQTLLCATRAPPEVRDIDSADYPLCCAVAGLPTWATTEPSRAAEPVKDKPSSIQPPLSSIRDALKSHDNDDDLSADAAPLVPSKSIRRSLAIPKELTPKSADTYFTTLATLDTPAAQPQAPAMRPRPLVIPTRTSSFQGRSRSSTSITKRSSDVDGDVDADELPPRPASMGSDSDTVPSLSWSRNSPSSDSASDTLESAPSAGARSSEDGDDASDSSSIYSERSAAEPAAAPSPPKKSAARLEPSVYGGGESLEKALWGDDGIFVCPGLSG